MTTETGPIRPPSQSMCNPDLAIIKALTSPANALPFTIPSHAMTAINTLDQWRLLVRVCPLFGAILPWASRSKNARDEMVVTEAAASLRTNLELLKIVVPADETFDDDKITDFTIEIEGLLSRLETLLEDSIMEEAPSSRIHGSPNERIMVSAFNG